MHVPSDPVNSAVTAAAVSSAHEQIRQVAARYSRGVDRLDLATMQSAYWPDAVDDHGVYVGDAMAFCERVVSSHARFTSTMHCVMNHWIEVVDDRTAHGEVYNVTYLRSFADGADAADADGADAADAADAAEVLDTWWGRYLDRYECRDGEWRIIHRTCVHEGTERRSIDAAMPIDAARFRQGSADRGAAFTSPA